MFSASSGIAGRTQPKFGCQLFSYYTAKPDGPAGRDPEQKKLLEDLLVSGQDSFQSRSKAREPEPNEITTLLNLTRAFGNEEGWGAAAYSQAPEGRQEFQRVRHQDPAYEDPQYARAVNALADKGPHTLLAHIRQSEDPGPSDENAHPFHYGNWSLMHNGALDGTNTREVRSAIKHFKRATGAAPEGETDSEKTFFYFLDNLRNQVSREQRKNFDHLTFDDIGVEKVKAVFAQSVRDSIKLSWRENPQGLTLDVFQNVAKDFSGVQTGKSSRLQASPAGNFILSDGNTLMGTCYNRTLYYGFRTRADGKPEVFVVTEPMQPKTGKPVQWHEVPNGHMITLQRTDDGQKILKTIEPFLGEPAQKSLPGRIKQKIGVLIRWLKQALHLA